MNKEMNHDDRQSQNHFNSFPFQSHSSVIKAFKVSICSYKCSFCLYCYPRDVVEKVKYSNHAFELLLKQKTGNSFFLTIFCLPALIFRYYWSMLYFCWHSCDKAVFVYVWFLYPTKNLKNNYHFICWTDKKTLSKIKLLLRQFGWSADLVSVKSGNPVQEC